MASATSQPAGRSSSGSITRTSAAPIRSSSPASLATASRPGSVGVRPQDHFPPRQGCPSSCAGRRRCRQASSALQTPPPVRPAHRRTSPLRLLPLELTRKDPRSGKANGSAEPGGSRSLHALRRCAGCRGRPCGRADLPDRGKPGRTPSRPECGIGSRRRIGTEGWPEERLRRNSAGGKADVRWVRTEGPRSPGICAGRPGAAAPNRAAGLFPGLPVPDRPRVSLNHFTTPPPSPQPWQNHCPDSKLDRAARLSVLMAGRGTRAHPLRAAPPAQPGTVLRVEAQYRARHREPSPRGPACRLASILRLSHSLISDSSQPTARSPREIGRGKRPSEMRR